MCWSVPAGSCRSTRSVALRAWSAAEVPLRNLAQSNDQDIDIRIAAMDALCHYNSLDTARVLVSQLNGNLFGLSWQARRSLFLMTGQDFRYDEAAWLNYFATR